MLTRYLKFKAIFLFELLLFLLFKKHRIRYGGDFQPLSRVDASQLSYVYPS